MMINQVKNNNNEENKELTTRQWKLYKFLVNEFREDKTKWVNLKTIYYSLQDLYPRLSEKTAWNNQTARRQITDDILALKTYTKKYIKLVISTPNGVKIATKQEAKDYLEKERRSLVASLDRLYFQYKRARLHGQTRIVEKKEKDVVEVFLEG